MANLKEVKSRIKSVISTQQITKAMKMVAAAKLRRAQDRIIQMRPYARKLSTIIANVSADMSEDIINIYAEERPVKKVLVVIVSSDRGLCGAFNSNIFKAANLLVAKKYSKEAGDFTVHYMSIGKRANDYFNKRNVHLIKDFSTTLGDLNFENARKAAEFAMNGFVKGDYDRVELVYNEFKNVATQNLKTDQFLPIPPPEEVEENTMPVKFDYIFEPSKKDIITNLIPNSLKISFYKALLESNASEQGARMTAMDKATENADELLKGLRLTYNRTRQAAITKEILEIVGGAEALSSN